MRWVVLRPAMREKQEGTEVSRNDGLICYFWRSGSCGYCNSTCEGGGKLKTVGDVSSRAQCLPPTWLGTRVPPPQPGGQEYVGSVSNHLPVMPYTFYKDGRKEGRDRTARWKMLIRQGTRLPT